MENGIVLFIIVLVLIGYFFYTKEAYEPVQEIFTNQITQAQPNDHSITKNELIDAIKNIMTLPSNGANITYNQNKHDLLFKDFIVNSERRDLANFPNPNSYYIDLNQTVNKIYKAELIDVYVPAATDYSVNVPEHANRLYFVYNTTDCSGNVNSVSAFLVIQAGTYLNPSELAMELTRQFDIVLRTGGIKPTKSVGVNVNYDKNFNRYFFSDRRYSKITSTPSLVIYPKNGDITPNYIVADSMCWLLKLDYEGPAIYSPYESGPKYINSQNGVTYVDNAVLGDYGVSNGVPVPLNMDGVFSNCIISDIVLTDAKLYLSLGKLNGDTCTVVQDQNNSYGNVPSIFCQVPNNTTVSSASTKTLLGQPNAFSAIQFYNPPISKLNRFEVKWYNDRGKYVSILDHSFTIRVYYFQKRLDTTDFAYY